VSNQHVSDSSHETGVESRVLLALAMGLGSTRAAGSATGGEERAGRRSHANAGRNSAAAACLPLVIAPRSESGALSRFPLTAQSTPATA